MVQVAAPLPRVLGKQTQGDPSHSESQAKKKKKKKQRSHLHSLVHSVLFSTFHKIIIKKENQALVPQLLCVGMEQHLQGAGGLLCGARAASRREPTLTEEFGHEALFSFEKPNAAFILFCP